VRKVSAWEALVSALAREPGGIIGHWDMTGAASTFQSNSGQQGLEISVSGSRGVHLGREDEVREM
jgi:hypothetical protein